VRTVTVAGPDVAYKILDALVLGAGARIRRVETDPGTDHAFQLNHAVISQGVLLKSEWYEAGWAQTLYLYDQQEDTGRQHRIYRETVVHARYHVSSDFAFGAVIERNPMPPCCLAVETNRLTYGLTAAAGRGGTAVEGRYVYAPAYKVDDDFDVTRQTLAVQVFYPLGGEWTVTARVAYGFGHESGASVQLPSPFGTVTTADMLDVGRAMAIGAVHAL
jgi:hypothetical protein